MTKKTIDGARGLALLCLLAAISASAWAEKQNTQDPGAPLVRATAVQAFVYGYAADGMMERLSTEVLNPATRKAPFNQYYHYQALATPQVAPFRAPNNDTLYSTAWLDLRTEPALLRMPGTAGRYYTAHVMDLQSETIANIGQRVYGTDPGLFAVVGPGWKGELPAGVRAVVRCETVFATVLLRLFVSGPADVPNVVALQKRFEIRALSQSAGGKVEPARAPDLPLYQPKTVSDRFAMIDWVLRNNPTREGEQALMAQFAGLGLGPAHVVQQTPPSAAILEEAYADAVTAIRAAGPKAGKVVNGWRVQLQGIGSYGFDYLQRASVWEGGPLANVPEESIYLSALADADGKLLDGQAGVYSIHFPGGAIPPVNAFWSLTMYRMSDGMLVENPLSRYSIGDRTPGLKLGTDGALTIHVSHQRPASNQEANWLPAPEAPFYMVLRLYGPKAEVQTGRWTPPPVKRVGTR